MREIAASERMKHLFGAIILSALIVTACSEDSNRTDRIVVLDSWWSLDYAKQSCQQATQWLQQNRDLINQLGCDAVTSCKELMPRVNACANDPGPEVLQFFDQLAAQLASNTQCKGVTVVKYDGSMLIRMLDMKGRVAINCRLKLEKERRQWTCSSLIHGSSNGRRF